MLWGINTALRVTWQPQSRKSHRLCRGSEADEGGRRRVRFRQAGQEWLWGWSVGLQRTKETNWPGELRTSEETGR